MRTFTIDELTALLWSRITEKQLSVEDMREQSEQAVARTRLPEGVQTHAVDVGGVRCEWIEPAAASLGTSILHIHGGAYIMGSLATTRPLVAQLAVAASARVLTVDYRLAPEHPYPAGLADCLHVYQWLLASGQNPGSLIVSGDSAGAGLAVAVLVAAKAQGAAMPAGLACLSPWSDLTLSGGSLDANARHDPLVSRVMLTAAARYYAASADPGSPGLSPCRADLAGLPPMLIHVGGAEALLDDARMLADAAQRSGVAVDWECWPDMIHVWHAYAPGLREAAEAIQRVASWAKNRWASTP